MRRVIVVLSLVVLFALPVLAIDSSATVGFSIDKYVEITYFRQPDWKDPAVVSDGDTQATIYLEFKINGNVDYCWYWWGIDLDRIVVPAHWYVWGSATQGAYQDTTDIDGDGDTDEYHMYNDGAQKGFGYGLASALYVKGITLADGTMTNEKIGTATMTIVGDGSPCPHPGA